MSRCVRSEVVFCSKNSSHELSCRESKPHLPFIAPKLYCGVFRRLLSEQCPPPPDTEIELKMAKENLV